MHVGHRGIPQLLSDQDCALWAVGFCTAGFGLQVSRDVAFDQHDGIADFITPKYLWSGDCAHLVAMTGVGVDAYTHVFTLVNWLPTSNESPWRIARCQRVLVASPQGDWKRRCSIGVRLAATIG
jgi:hypothetical protein